MNKVNKIIFIDFAKGFSMLAIVIMHFFGALNLSCFLSEAIKYGRLGVHLFVFLSGFGLMLIRNKNIVQFYKRRFHKILIPYYIFVTLVILFNNIIKLYGNVNIYSYLGHIFFYKMFDNSIFYSFGPHLWFISAIIQFYILFPFLVKIKNLIGNNIFFIVSLIISINYWLFLFYIYRKYSFVPHVYDGTSIKYLWEFSLGMISAEMYIKYRYKPWEQSYKLLISIFILSTSILGILTIKLDYGNIINDIPAFLSISSLTALAYILTQNYFELLSNAVIYFGKISFFVYLIHVFVLDIYLYFFVKSDFAMYYDLIIPFLLTLFLSIFYRGIFQAWKR